MEKKSKKKDKKDILNSKKGLRNKETNIISYCFMSIFAIIMVYLVIFNEFLAKDILNNPYNSLVDTQEDNVIRGDILASDGTVLATTQVDSEGNQTRVYPLGSVFSHVVGFNNNGRSGLELSENYYLLSKADNVLSQISDDIDGEKYEGDDVYTTLSVKLQEAAYEALGTNKGAVIAMDPQTGEILCMVSYPSYDPNDAVEDYSTWLTYDSDDSVLLNRATQGLYPPGSTFKILTLLAYMEQNADYEDFTFSCSGSVSISGGTKINCAGNTAHGYETLVTAFANSCNSAFATIGVSLTRAEYISLVSRFLFNQSLGVDFTYNQSSFALTTSSSTSAVEETAIGQGQTMISPLHNLMIASSVANDGVMLKPYLVDKVVDSNGNTVISYDSEELGIMMSEKQAEYITTCMKQVCKTGTGSAFRNYGVSVAGKTGSAQYGDGSNYHSWFVGFAPADNPKIAICVILEGGFTGVSSAQYVARDVLDAYFGY